MNVRKPIRATGLFAALALSACGTPPPEVVEQRTGAAVDECGLQIPIAPLPVTIHLTSISMNANSVNPSQEVTVYVTLPGLATTSTFIGYYAPNNNGDPNTEFNCRSVDALPGPNGYCTPSLPLNTTIGPTTFTGTFPDNATSGNGSVQINGTKVNFTIDNHGNMSQSCATTWMYINGSIIDGDQITVCWAAGVEDPITAPPAIQTIFYSAPGESSSVSLKQSNTIQTKTTWGGTTGESIGVKDDGKIISDSFTISATQSFSHSDTEIDGNASGFTLKSKAMYPDPDDDTFVITVGVPAAFVDYRAGGAPVVIQYFSSGGHVEVLTMRELKGLAQTPQNFTDILPGDQCIIAKYITPDVAQGFLGQDPFFNAGSADEAVASDPNRFQPAANSPLALWHGDRPTSDDAVHGSGTDDTIGWTIGGSYTETILGVGATGSDTLTVSITHSDTNQSTGSITLDTHDPCIDGAVDLYMDKQYGTILPVPHLMNVCNAPTDACTCDPYNPDPNDPKCANGVPPSHHVLLPDQYLTPGGPPLMSCNHKWTLTLQPGGMLVENYSDGSIATSFYTPGAATAIMQDDGNFVVYDPVGNPLMDTGTWGNSGTGAYFILQDDGTLDIYQPALNPINGESGEALPRGALWSILPGG